MKEVRLGVIGVGAMGTNHARNVEAGKVRGMRLTAVCDVNPKQLAKFKDTVKKFTDHRELLKSGEVDAVLIVTPHYAHTTIGIDALKAGVHVLVEKPISVHKADCQRLIAAHTRRKQVFAAMFNQRTDPHYQRIRNMIQAGELGELQRVNWIITNWLRTEVYYKSGSWRATWDGEGGGVLMNQSPHQLDLLQWLCGMPTQVRAFCQLGQFHDIEVEDNVTAYLEYANGASGVFITTTGEAPGTNRLEICGTRGKIVVEEGNILFTRNETPSDVFLKTSKSMYDGPPVWNVQIPVDGRGGQHVEIMQNFTDAILDGTPLIAPAREGIRSVELANAMLLSALTEKTVKLPISGPVFEKTLKGLIRKARRSK
jgi:predicted dehydrogenase